MYRLCCLFIRNDIGVVLAVWAGRLTTQRRPPTSQHGTLGDFWLMATMATMATLVADLLKTLHFKSFCPTLACTKPLIS